MKIAYSIASIDNSGGIERVLCTKANYFTDVLGYEVHIITLKEAGKTFFPFSSSSNIQIHSLEIEKIRHEPWMILGSRSRKEYEQKLLHRLNVIKPDITISFFGLDAEFLYKAKDGSKKVLEFHFTKNYLTYLGKSLVNDRFRFLRRIWLQFLLKKEAYFAGKYDHIVLLTEKDKVLWGGGDKLEVIPNPLSFESHEVAPLENKIIIAMGRLVLPKGFQYLIQAFSQLKDQFPDWEVFILGEGQDKTYLQSLINELSLQNHILIKKPVVDVEHWMLDASLLVLPSYYEGFGLVLTEAMACGVPCVAFDCECGPSEIISDQQDGLLVKLNDVDDLKDKMQRLMADEEMRKTFGERAKHNVQRFEINKVMRLWENYFEKILNE